MHEDRSKEVPIIIKERQILNLVRTNEIFLIFYPFIAVEMVCSLMYAITA